MKLPLLLVNIYNKLINVNYLTNYQNIVNLNFEVTDIAFFFLIRILFFRNIKKLSAKNGLKLYENYAWFQPSAQVGALVCFRCVLKNLMANF